LPSAGASPKIVPNRSESATDRQRRAMQGHTPYADKSLQRMQPSMLQGGFRVARCFPALRALVAVPFAIALVANMTISAVHAQTPTSNPAAPAKPPTTAPATAPAGTTTTPTTTGAPPPAAPAPSGPAPTLPPSATGAPPPLAAPPSSTPPSSTGPANPCTGPRSSAYATIWTGTMGMDAPAWSNNTAASTSNCPRTSAAPTGASS
jgi:hypothetical protein